MYKATQYNKKIETNLIGKYNDYIYKSFKYQVNTEEYDNKNSQKIFKLYKTKQNFKHLFIDWTFHHPIGFS